VDETSKAALLSALRTLLAAGGAWMATHQYIDSAMANEIVGAVMIIIPLVWGAYDKFKVERETKQRETAAVNAGIVIADKTVGPTPLSYSPENTAAIIASNASSQIGE
jgi:FtsH-binding integral membrane protein